VLQDASFKDSGFIGTVFEAEIFDEAFSKGNFSIGENFGRRSKLLNVSGNLWRGSGRRIVYFSAAVLRFHRLCRCPNENGASEAAPSLDAENSY